MRIWLLASAMVGGSAAFVAAPAVARDGEVYIEADVGAMLALDSDVTDPSSTIPTEIDYKTGYDFGGAVGYDFGPFRLEGEVSHRRAGVKALSGQFFEGETETVGTGTRDATGRGTALSAMANLLLDIGKDGGTQGFVGGGLGVAEVSLRADDGVLYAIDDKDSGFAWQVLAGLRTPVSNAVDFGLKYRFFNVEGLDFTSTTTGQTNPAESSWRSHSLLASLTYNFGSRPLPPAAEPAPKPVPPLRVAIDPPPPPIPVCNQGPFIVFFDWDRSEITAEAADILDQAIAAYNDCGNAQISLSGHADRSGSDAYNVGLSERRNAAVTRYLIQQGLPGSVIDSRAYGETQNRVPTADGVRELQNRRVEITYGPDASR